MPIMQRRRVSGRAVDAAEETMGWSPALVLLLGPILLVAQGQARASRGATGGPYTSRTMGTMTCGSAWSRIGGCGSGHGAADQENRLCCRSMARGSRCDRALRSRWAMRREGWMSETCASASTVSSTPASAQRATHDERHAGHRREERRLGARAGGGTIMARDAHTRQLLHERWRKVCLEFTMRSPGTQGVV